MTFAQQVLQFHHALQPDWQLPPSFELLFPFKAAETLTAMTAFFDKYYADEEQRTFLFGINPGRFGAGVTGIAFTDPVRLASVCGIENDFHKRQELSSVFVYEVVAALGGARAFYQQFYISSVCPLGFTKGGNNINYYDDKKLQEAVEPYIISSLDKQTTFGCNRKIAFCLGQGKNFKYFNKLNQKGQWFDEIVPLPHPRWVMQYRRKRLEEFVEMYRAALDKSIA